MPSITITVVSHPASVKSAFHHSASFNANLQASLTNKTSRAQLPIRACHSMADKKEAYKQVGMLHIPFSLNYSVQQLQKKSHFSVPYSCLHHTQMFLNGLIFR